MKKTLHIDEHLLRDAKSGFTSSQIARRMRCGSMNSWAGTKRAVMRRTPHCGRRQAETTAGGLRADASRAHGISPWGGPVRRWPTTPLPRDWVDRCAPSGVGTGRPPETEDRRSAPRDARQRARGRLRL